MVGKPGGPGKVGLLGCPGKGLLGSMVHKLLISPAYKWGQQWPSHSHFLKGFIEWAVWDPIQMSIHGLYMGVIRATY